MKTKSHNNIGDSVVSTPFLSGKSTIGAWLVLSFLWYAVLITLTCPYTLEMQEARSTMYYVPELITDMLMCPKGISEILALMVVQTFKSAWIAVIATALIVTLCTALIASVISSVVRWSAPLSLAAGSAVALVHCYPSYSYTALIAITLMAIALWIYTRIRAKGFKPLIALAFALLVYWMAGPVAIVFSAMALIIELGRDPRKVYLYLTSIIGVVFMAVINVRQGICADIEQALTPAGYYTAWRSAPMSLLIPWGVCVAALVAAEILRFIKLKSQKTSLIAATTCTVAAIGISAALAVTMRQPREEKYAQLSALVGKGLWQEVILSSRDLDIDDVRSHNCRNLALAETGQLAKALFSTPCAGPQSLIAVTEKSPEAYITLSDIFYAIGHYSLAQKYAFEANQGLGNMSPRMLKRLAQISIATGQNEVAKKYLGLLSHTLNYAGWAKEQLAHLSETRVLEPEMSPLPESSDKGEATDPTAPFALIHGIDYDLKEIIRQTPDNRIAMEYLGMWLLASKRVPEFTSVISEFYGTDALPTPLPKHFQEAIAVATLATDERLDIKYGIHPTTIDHCRQFWSQHRDSPNTFWHYLKHSGQNNL